MYSLFTDQHTAHVYVYNTSFWYSASCVYGLKTACVSRHLSIRIDRCDRLLLSLFPHQLLDEPHSANLYFVFVMLVLYSLFVIFCICVLDFVQMLPLPFIVSSSVIGQALLCSLYFVFLYFCIYNIVFILCICVLYLYFELVFCICVSCRCSFHCSPISYWTSTLCQLRFGLPGCSAIM